MVGNGRPSLPHPKSLDGQLWEWNSPMMLANGSQGERAFITHRWKEAHGGKSLYPQLRQCRWHSMDVGRQRVNRASTPRTASLTGLSGGLWPSELRGAWTSLLEALWWDSKAWWVVGFVPESTLLRVLGTWVSGDVMPYYPPKKTFKHQRTKSNNPPIPQPHKSY